MFLFSNNNSIPLKKPDNDARQNYHSWSGNTRTLNLVRIHSWFNTIQQPRKLLIRVSQFFYTISKIKSFKKKGNTSVEVDLHSLWGYLGYWGLRSQGPLWSFVSLCAEKSTHPTAHWYTLHWSVIRLDYSVRQLIIRSII